MSFIEDFIRGLLQVEAPRPKPKRHPVYRPTMKEFQNYVSRLENRTMFHRFNLEYRGETYYVMYVYIRSAIYTATYERRPRNMRPRYRIVCVYRGKMTPREILEALHFALKKRKAAAARAATTWGLSRRHRRDR